MLINLDESLKDIYGEKPKCIFLCLFTSLGFVMSGFACCCISRQKVLLQSWVEV